MWHYIHDGKTIGPIPDEQANDLVRNGIITRQTLVWRESMASWQPAESTELFVDSSPPASSGPLPPPLPPQPTNDKTLCVLAHVLGLLTGFLGPLIILLASPNHEVKRHARTALNWQISLIIYMIVSFVLMLILIGFLFIFALMIMDLVFCIVGAVKASNGLFWKYPLTIPFVQDGSPS